MKLTEQQKLEIALSFGYIARLGHGCDANDKRAYYWPNIEEPGILIPDNLEELEQEQK